MKRALPTLKTGTLFAATVFLSTAIAGPTAPPPALSKSLTLHASFDDGPNADFAKGDRVLYLSKTAKREAPVPGLPKGVVIAKGKGKRGDALHFVEKGASALFFRAEKNIDYRRSDWSGTISFWIGSV